MAIGLGPLWIQASQSAYQPAQFGYLPTRFSSAVLVVAPIASLVVSRRWPRLAPATVLVVALAVLGTCTANLSVRLVPLLVLPPFLWAIGTRAIELPWVDDRSRRALRVTFLPLALLAAWMLAPHGVVFSLRLTLPIALLAVAVLAHPGLRERAAVLTDRVAAPFTAGAGAGDRRSVPRRVGGAARGVDGVLLSIAPLAVRIGAWFAHQRPRPDTVERVATDDGPVTGWRRPATWARRYATPFLAWSLLAYLMSKVQLGASIRWNHADPAFFRLGPTFSDATGKIGWGSGDYWKIADHGYRLSEGVEAAFPLYALLVRWASPIYGDIARTEVVLSTLSGLASTLLLWRWMLQREVAAAARRVALALFLLYPYSFMLLGIAYNDAFLVPMVIGAFILVESDHPVWAGAVAGAATFTRPNALPLVLGLVVYELARNQVVSRREVATTSHGPSDDVLGGFPPDEAPIRDRAMSFARSIELHPRRLQVRQLGVLLSVTGVAGFSFWMYRHAGDPLYWLTVQARYGHRPTTAPATWVKAEFINNPWAFMDHGMEAANHGLALLTLVVAAFGLRGVVRRFGWGQGAFALGVILTSWVGPNGFAPAGRYLLPILPAYAIAGGELLVDRPRILRPLLVVSAVLSLTLTVLFAKSDLWLEW